MQNVSIPPAPAQHDGSIAIYVGTADVASGIQEHAHDIPAIVPDGHVEGSAVAVTLGVDVTAVLQQNTNDFCSRQQEIKRLKSLTLIPSTQHM